MSHIVKYCLRITLSLTQMDGPGAVCTADSFAEVEPGLVRKSFSCDYIWKACRGLQQNEHIQVCSESKSKGLMQRGCTPRTKIVWTDMPLWWATN